MSAEEKCRFCDSPADHECCSTHKARLCHRCYKRTHFVEVCGCAFCKRDLVSARSGVTQ